MGAQRVVLAPLVPEARLHASVRDTKEGVRCVDMRSMLGQTDTDALR
jgi:hypothetical protein